MSRREQIDFIIDARKDMSANTINLLTLSMTDEELKEFFNNVVDDVKDSVMDRY